MMSTLISEADYQRRPQAELEHVGVHVRAPSEHFKHTPSSPRSLKTSQEQSERAQKNIPRASQRTYQKALHQLPKTTHLCQGGRDQFPGFKILLRMLGMHNRTAIYVTYGS